jgi:hypothetical protein
MHPSLFSSRKDKRDRRKGSNKDESDSEWVTNICVALSGGDILKGQDILWGFTVEETRPYLEYKSRDVLFREAVLSFLGVKTQSDTQDEYCKVCKAANPDMDCSTCDKELEIIEDKKIGR